MKKLIITGFLMTAAALALAKLPPPTDEAKSKAAEAAAKAAWNGKVGAYQSCKAQDRAAAHYYKSVKDTKPAQAMPPCADPGAFSYVPVVVAKPLEAAGAHSPALTATSPPNSNAPAAVIAPVKKP